MCRGVHQQQKHLGGLGAGVCQQQNSSLRHAKVTCGVQAALLLGGSRWQAAIRPASAGGCSSSIACHATATVGAPLHVCPVVSFENCKTGGQCTNVLRPRPVSGHMHRARRDCTAGAKVGRRVVLHPFQALRLAPHIIATLSRASARARRLPLFHNSPATSVPAKQAHPNQSQHPRH